MIENSIDFTGGLNSIMRSCSSLDDKYEFLFVVPKKSGSKNFVLERGMMVYEWPMKEIRRNIKSIFFYLPYLVYNVYKLHGFIRKNKIELIISNDLYNMLPPVLRMIGGQVPYVCYVRFLPSKFPKYLVQLWSWLHFNFAISVIAVSQAVKRELPFKENVVVIGNELPEKDVNFIPATANLILYPSNYINGKGHDLALLSFAVIAMKYPGWRLKFIGSDMGLPSNKEYRKKLNEKILELNLKELVECADFSLDMEKEYLGAGLVLNFSESESFSLTCLEAMFYGRAVVATASGGPQEIIEHDSTGILVNVKDIPSMINGIESLIASEEKRRRISENAYHSVRKKFNPDEIKNMIDSVYLNAICSKKI